MRKKGFEEYRNIIYRNKGFVFSVFNENEITYAVYDNVEDKYLKSVLAGIKKFFKIKKFAINDKYILGLTIAGNVVLFDINTNSFVNLEVGLSSSGIKDIALCNDYAVLLNSNGKISKFDSYERKNLDKGAFGKYIFSQIDSNGSCFFAVNENHNLFSSNEYINEKIKGFAGIESVSASNTHIAMITSGGRVRCVKIQSDSLDLDTRDLRNINIVEVSAGYNYIMALDENGNVYEINNLGINKKNLAGKKAVGICADKFSDKLPLIINDSFEVMTYETNLRYKNIDGDYSAWKVNKPIETCSPIDKAGISIGYKNPSRTSDDKYYCKIILNKNNDKGAKEPEPINVKNHLSQDEKNEDCISPYYINNANIGNPILIYDDKRKNPNKDENYTFEKLKSI